MVVDASVWVSGLIAQDAHHVASRRWLDQRLSIGETLVVPTLVLAEVAGAVARRTGANDLGWQAAEEILQAPGLRLVGLDTGLAAETARVAATYQLRGADAVYVAVAHSLNLPLVTWDREVQARTGGFIDVLQP